MIKLSNCKTIVDVTKDIDQFELYIDIISYTDNKRLNKMYNKLKEYSTIKLQSIKYQNNYCIIHKSAKKLNIIQLSYFDNKGAYADKEVTSYKDALSLIYKSYSVCEVV